MQKLPKAQTTWCQRKRGDIERPNSFPHAECVGRGRGRPKGRGRPGRLGRPAGRGLKRPAIKAAAAKAAKVAKAAEAPEARTSKFLKLWKVSETRGPKEWWILSPKAEAAESSTAVGQAPPVRLRLQRFRGPEPLLGLAEWLWSDRTATASTAAGGRHRGLALFNLRSDKGREALVGWGNEEIERAKLKRNGNTLDLAFVTFLKNCHCSRAIVLFRLGQVWWRTASQ